MKTWTINFYLLLLAIINGHCFTIYAPKFYHDKDLLDLRNTLFKDRYDDSMEEPSMIDKRTEETLAHCIQFHCGGFGKGGRGKYLMCLHNRCLRSVKMQKTKRMDEIINEPVDFP